MKNNQYFCATKKLILILPVILAFFFIFLKVKFNNVYTKIIQEDNLIEYAEVVVYFLSFLFAFIAAISFFETKHKLCGLFYLVLCILFVFICGEEISWGQRIFGIKSPEYFLEHNVQKEINLHNLNMIHNPAYLIYFLVGFLGAFAWMLLPKKINAKYNFAARFFIPEWFLTFYFLPVFITYLCYCLYGFSILFLGVKPFCIGDGSFIVWRDQEPAELILSLGFLFFVVTNYIKLRK